MENILYNLSRGNSLQLEQFCSHNIEKLIAKSLPQNKLTFYCEVRAEYV